MVNSNENKMLSSITSLKINKSMTFSGTAKEAEGLKELFKKTRKATVKFGKTLIKSQ